MRKALLFILLATAATACKDDEPDEPPGLGECIECVEDVECPGYLNTELCSEGVCTLQCDPDNQDEYTCFVSAVPGYPGGGTQVGTCYPKQNGGGRCIDDQIGNVCVDHPK